MSFDAVRWSKQFVVAASILFISLALARSTALAQERFSSGELPDAPSLAQAGAQSPAISPQQESSANLSGTVVDKRGDVLQGARVTLSGPAGTPVGTVQSGVDGQFQFKGLPPTVYKLTVTAPGMITFTSSDIPLRAGEFHILPPVTLAISPVTTSVTPELCSQT